MDDSTIRSRIVRRLWNDGIVETSRCADVDTVADFAVPSSEEGRAKELIKNKMVSNSDCPVVWGIANKAITLTMDRERVARYIKTHGGEEALPWDLKGVLKGEDTNTELTDASQ
jgi:hypothetical protein